MNLERSAVVLVTSVSYLRSALRVSFRVEGRHLPPLVSGFAPLGYAENSILHVNEFKPL